MAEDGIRKGSKQPTREEVRDTSVSSKEGDSKRGRKASQRVDNSEMRSSQSSAQGSQSAGGSGTSGRVSSDTVNILAALGTRGFDAGMMARLLSLSLSSSQSAAAVESGNKGGSDLFTNTQGRGGAEAFKGVVLQTVGSATLLGSGHGIGDLDQKSLILPGSGSAKGGETEGFSSFHSDALTLQLNLTNTESVTTNILATVTSGSSILAPQASANASNVVIFKDGVYTNYLQSLFVNGQNLTYTPNPADLDKGISISSTGTVTIAVGTNTVVDDIPVSVFDPNTKETTIFQFVVIASNQAFNTGNTGGPNILADGTSNIYGDGISLLFTGVGSVLTPVTNAGLAGTPLTEATYTNAINNTIVQPNVTTTPISIFGDFQSVSVPSSSLLAMATGQNYTMGSNTITTRGGTSYGDVQSFDLSLTGVNAVPAPTDNQVSGHTFTFGTNLLSVPETAYGAAQTVTFQATNQSTLTPGSPADTYKAILSNDNLVFGNNTIVSPVQMQGNAYGDLQTLNLAAQGINNFVSSGGAADLEHSILNSNFTFGNNMITEANVITDANNDPVSDYGTAQNINITVTGGNNPTINDNSTAYNITGNYSNNTMTFGNNTITITGEIPQSGIDLYGNFDQLAVTLVQGALGQATVTGAVAVGSLLNNEAYFTGNSFVLGDNTITLTSSTITKGGTGTENLYADDGSLGASTAATSSTEYGGFYYNPTATLLTSTTGPAHVQLTDFVLGVDPVTHLPVPIRLFGGEVGDNTLTLGNNTLIGSEAGKDTFNLNWFGNSATGPLQIYSGFDTIKNYQKSDVINISVPQTILDDPSFFSSIRTQYQNGNTIFSFKNEGSSLGSLTITGASLTTGQLNFIPILPAPAPTLTGVLLPTLIMTSGLNSFFSADGLGTAEPSLKGLFAYTGNPEGSSALTYQYTNFSQNALEPGVQITVSSVQFLDTGDVTNTGTGLYKIALPEQITAYFAPGETTTVTFTTPEYAYVGISPTVINVAAGQSQAGTLLSGSNTIVGQANDQLYGAAVSVSINNSNVGTYSYGNDLIVDLDTTPGSTTTAAGSVGSFSMAFVENVGFNGSPDVLIGTGTFNPTLAQSTTFGSNLIDLATGTIYGNVQTFNLSVESLSHGLSSEDGFVTVGSSSIGAIIDSVSFGGLINGLTPAGNSTIFGSNTIWGAGNIYGDVSTITIQTISDQATVANSLFKAVRSITNIGYDTFHFGADNIYGYTGQTGSVYGEFSSLNLLTQANTASDIIPVQGSFMGETYLVLPDFSSNMTNNTFTGGGDTFVFSNSQGTYYGDGQTIAITVTAGNYILDNSVNLVSDGTQETFSPGTLVLHPGAAASFISNQFNFSHDTMTFSGNTSPNTYYGTIENLTVALQAGTINNNILNFSVVLDVGAYFEKNSFNFNADNTPTTIVGGSGNETFYGNLPSFGSLSATPGTIYEGFYNGVSVSGGANQVTITTTDGNANSITFANVIMTGGGGNDIFNFTLVGDNTLNGTTPTPKPVFEGFQTITDFNGHDKLVFQLTPFLETSIDPSGDPTKFLSLLSGLTTVSHPQANQTMFSFSGGGALTVAGHFTSLSDLATKDPGSVVILGSDGSTELVGTIGADILTATTNPTTVVGGELSLTFDTTLAPDPLVFGNDTINNNVAGTSPNNISYGSVVTEQTSISQPASSVQSEMVTYGSNTINSLGTVYGDLKTLTATVTGYGGVGGGHPTQPGDVYYGSSDGSLYSNFDPLSGNTHNFGSNSINTVGTAYGDLNTVTISIDGGNSQVAGVLGTPTTANGVMEFNQFNFGSDSFSAPTGGANASINDYGNFQSLVLNSLGGAPNGVAFADAQSLVDHNAFNGGNNSIGTTMTPFLSGGNSTFFGDGQDIAISVTGGNAGTNGDDSSAIFDSNNFNFNDNSMVFDGTAVASTNGNVYYGSIEDLAISTTNGATVTGSTSNATFTNNNIVFGNGASVTTITGGSGTQTFFGNPDTYGSLSGGPGTYDGFDNGAITETTVNGHVQITDANNNTLTFANVDMTGGNVTSHSQDTFNFTLLPLTTTGPTPTTLAVFAGNQTILDYNTNDVLDFKIANGLYNNLTGGTGTPTVAELQTDVSSVTHPDSHTSVFTFNGGGTLTLTGSTFAGSLTNLSSITHINVVHVG